MQPLIMNTGFTRHPEFMTIEGGSLKAAKFPASVVYIEHPRHGKILFDTGYAPRFFDVTKRFPEKLYAWVTPVFVKDTDTAAYQLQARGIAADEIDYVIISHFHADHVAGLGDYPKAKFIFLDEAYSTVMGYSRFKAVRKGFLRDLLPEDFSSRAAPVAARERRDLLPHVQALRQYDLFGDGSLLGIGLPGHAAGHMGLWMPQLENPLFFVADACWHARQYVENKGAGALAYLIMDDKQGYKATIKNLHRIHQSHSQLTIVPCHCERTLPLVTGQG